MSPAKWPLHHSREYSAVKVGDAFGTKTVVRLLPRDHTSNERVAWVCTCGREGRSYVFNLRTAIPDGCSSCWRSRKAKARSLRGGAR